MKIDPGSLVLPGYKEIEIIHKATIEKHGGLNARPSKKKIESALANVIIYHSYVPDADICTLAAVVAYDFAKGHHPLPDGNKRVAFAVVRMVARLNWIRLEATPRRGGEANLQACRKLIFGS
jgi:prophage maintenance system killer protein